MKLEDTTKSINKKNTDIIFLFLSPISPVLLRLTIFVFCLRLETRDKTKRETKQNKNDQHFARSFAHR